jgi:predicted dehydrogenase
MNQVDAVFLATPNHTHFSIASYFLERDISVLVEKPVALSSDNYKHLKNKQMPKGPVLHSGMVKRCLPINKVLKKIFRHKLLGNLKAFNLEEGMNFNWPIRSLSFFDKEKAGGGVLIDNGIHVLDLLFWWLQSSGQLPELTSFKYQDDDQGGVEAECMVQLSFEDGLTGACHFSRLRPLSQSWQLNFEKGCITLKKGEVFLSVQKGLEKHYLIKQLRSIKRRTLRYAFQEQLKVFEESVKYGRQEDDPVIPYTITLINQLYAHRQTLTSSYYQFT